MSVNTHSMPWFLQDWHVPLIEPLVDVEMRRIDGSPRVGWSGEQAPRSLFRNVQPEQWPETGSRHATATILQSWALTTEKLGYTDQTLIM